MTKSWDSSDTPPRSLYPRWLHGERGYSPVTILFLSFLSLICLLLVISYFWSSCRPNSDGNSEENSITRLFGGVGPGLSSSDPDKVSIVLYFLDESTMSLVAESRDVSTPTPTEISAAISVVINELLVGSSSNLTSVIPEGTRLRQVYFDNARTCYLDFSTELVTQHPGGASDELLTVMALVKTVVENFQDIDRVQLLVEGAEIDTIAGHIRVDQPLAGSEFGQSGKL